MSLLLKRTFIKTNCSCSITQNSVTIIRVVPTYYVVKRTMGLLSKWTEFQLCQVQLYYFCEIFGYNLSEKIEFLAKHKDHIDNYPPFTHFYYQRALEAVTKNIYYSNTDIRELFHDNIKLVDMYSNLNKGMSDAYTFNSMIIINHMKRGHSIFNNLDIAVVSTPLEYRTEKYYRIQNNNLDTKAYVTLSRTTTANTNAEVKLDHRVYDIKHTVHTSTAANHIYPWTFEQMESKLHTHFDSLHTELKSRPHATIRQILIDKLEAIKNDKTLSVSEKSNLWNQVIVKMHKRLPSDECLPIIVQMTDYEQTRHIPKKILEKIHVSPETVNLHQPMIDAITGITVIRGHKYNRNANIISEGNIPLIEISTSVDELD